MQDELYMQRCIELAQRSLGKNQPNPEVGSVIVYNGKIIGEGYHAVYGSAHAEVNAVASVQESDKHLLPEATLYVTLEPCFHFGKTPPCVDLVLRTGFRRVVIGCQDPYSEVAGRSIAKLREAGVEVRVGVLEQEIEWLNRRFFTVCRHNRPYIILKYATSPDGYMGIAGQNVRISNEYSQRLLHRWRSEESAILVGTNTALTDNPQLTNRLYPIYDRQPLRLVLDRQGRLPHDLHIFDGNYPTCIFTEKAAHPSLPNVTFEQLDFSDNFIPNLLAILQRRRLQSVLVEGGAQLLQSFLDAGLWDEARIFVGAKPLGMGIAAPRLQGAVLRQEENLVDNKVQWWVRAVR